MNIILFLLTFPIIVAVFLYFIKNEGTSAIIAKVSSAVLGFTAIVLAIKYFNNPNEYHVVNSIIVNFSMIAVECVMTLYIAYTGIKHKHYGVVALSICQTVAMLWFELGGRLGAESIGHHLFVDKLTVIMVVIIAIVGGLIVIFATDYMKEYHDHHKEVRDRRNLFFALMFLFFSAMFGIVFSNDLVWIYFFWEITTICSFLFIGYSESEESTVNAFTALALNLIGGGCFVVAIMYFGFGFGITELKDILQLPVTTTGFVIPAMFLGIACLAKAAQFPFSKWLLGAMVAPTPVSALLHSATMVKAGVYLLIRISPLLVNNLAGYMIIFIGGITFLLASCIAINQSDAKKILAYSTIANLGLITACAGVGHYESIWAGIMLLIFHAVSKSLMFLSVGATENILGSRDIEDMHGLTVRLPEMALLMAIGISAMFLAPFGMLISKWAALRAFIDSKQVIIVVVLAYGSAATLFYWTKWLGKIASYIHKSERLKCTVKLSQWVSLISHATIAIGLCILFPLVSDKLIIPYLHDVFNIETINIISKGNQYIMMIMLGLIVILPFGMHFLTNREEKIIPVYMSGINAGDNKSFKNSLGNNKKMYLSSWYMDKYFNERKLYVWGKYGSIMLIICMFVLAIGGVA